MEQSNGGDLIVVGIATIDIIDTVAFFPIEDSKQRVLSRSKRRGGNGTNMLAVCAQLISPTVMCTWLGTLTNPKVDADATFVLNDLKRYGVNCESVKFSKDERSSIPTSHIIQVQYSGSRTILHHRNLEELTAVQFQDVIQGNLQPTKWFHFEGRNIDQLLLMIRILHDAVCIPSISLEIESPRYEWRKLLPILLLSKIVFVSKSYIKENLKLMSANDFFEFVRPEIENEGINTTIICPWDIEGAYVMTFSPSHMSAAFHVPAKTQDTVVDTIGAGDTFIAATVAAMWSGKNVRQSVEFGCTVAGTKCAQLGFHFDPKIIKQWKQELQ